MSADLLERLREALPEGLLREVEPTYLNEPRGTWRGRAGAVVAPRDVGEVARVIRFAHENRVPVVPWGGGTGLVGGQVSEIGAPIVLSLERMARIRQVWPEENAMAVDAGITLQAVQEAAEEAGRMFPLDLAPRGTARIGGLLATNAGGLGVLRYGNARDLVLGVEAVLPDGTVFDGMKRLRKDNAGYDLRHLLIGAEGTLGVITGAVLRLVPRPASFGTALMVVEGPEAALELLHLAQAQGEGVSAFELISGQGLRFLAETDVPAKMPFEAIPDWCALIELGLGPGDDPEARLEALFTEGADAGLVSDGVVARSEGQRQSLWALREGIPEANRRVGAIISNDVSVPLSQITPFLQRAGERVAAIGPFRVNAFGHLGDGNLHYNIFPPEGEERDGYMDRADALRAAIHEVAHDLQGSFAAEHGVGRLKVEALAHFGDPGLMAAMRAIKGALDPHGIMNPGAVLAVE